MLCFTDKEGTQDIGTTYYNCIREATSGIRTGKM